MKAPLLQWDNLDDRGEVWRLLSRLPPRVRWRFVRWCCSRSRGQRGPSPPLLFNDDDRERIEQAERFGGKADTFDVNQAYSFLWVLSAQWGLDLDAASGMLVALVRGKFTIAELERGQCVP